jgi:hypothetical protein
MAGEDCAASDSEPDRRVMVLELAGKNDFDVAYLLQEYVGVFVADHALEMNMFVMMAVMRMAL